MKMLQSMQAQYESKKEKKKIRMSKFNNNDDESNFVESPSKCYSTNFVTSSSSNLIALSESKTKTKTKRCLLLASLLAAILLTLSSASSSSAAQQKLGPVGGSSMMEKIQQREHMHFKTTYACEGNQLEINCGQEGKLIHVARATYGRFSLSICNEFGHSNLSVQCAAFRAYLIMENKCNSLANCSVIVSKDLFGDPCEGTSKYLEVQYYCYDANQPAAASATSLPSSSLPQITQVQQQVAAAAAAATQQQQVAASSISAQNGVGASQALATPNNSNNQQQQQQQAHHKSPHTNQQQQVVNNNNVGGNSVPSPQQSSNHFNINNNNNNNEPLTSRQQQQATTSSTVIQQQQQDRFCLPQTSARNFYWNYTRFGQVTRQNCPDGFTGQVSWLCDPERGRFFPPWSPDFSQCSSIWLHKLSQQLMQLPNLDESHLSSTVMRHNNQWSALGPIKLILTDLALMSETKELFSTDLRQIHSMLAQLIRRLRIIASQSLSNELLQTVSTQSVYDEIFNKLSQIVSNLFDINQKSCWLELRKLSLIRRMEQQLLDQLKEAATFLLPLTATQTDSNQIEQQQQPLRLQVSATVRQTNLAVALVTVMNRNLLDLPDSEELSLPIGQLAGAQQFVSAANLESNYQQGQVVDQQAAVNELRLNVGLLKELLATGVTRFLLLEVRKPDYELMEQQLESAAAASLLMRNAFIQDNQSTSNTLDASSNSGNLFSADAFTQWSSRVFGVIPLVESQESSSTTTTITKSAKLLANQLRPSQSLNELLAQWPISVDFRLLSQLPLSPFAPSASGFSSLKQCISMSGSSSDTSDININININDQQQQQPIQNRCHTFRSNSTNFVCRCDQFGFLALNSRAAPSTLIQQQQQQVPSTTLTLPDFQWPSQLLPAITTKSTDGNYDPSQQQQQDANQWSPATYIGAQQNNYKHQQQSTSQLSIWTTIFIVLGLSLLVVSLGAFVINTIWRVSSQCKLDKKKKKVQSFFASSNGGPTTAPMPIDHNLMSSGDPIVTSSNTSNATETHSGSLFGLAPSNYHGYKSHQQQLYAAHLPPMEVCGGGGGWARATCWLKQPSRWLSRLISKDNQHGSGMIQHRIIGSSLTGQSSLSTYKSQYQNGYTTSLHHHHQHLHQPHLQQQQQQPQLQSNLVGNHHHQSASQMPLAALSSSTSSYVSSSAYYEEIGPANLTKINTNQLTGNNSSSANNSRSTHTIVEPFRRQQTTNDQQQLLLNHHQHHIHHPNNNSNSNNMNWSAPSGTAQPTSASLSYSIQEPLSQLSHNHHHQHQTATTPNYGQQTMSQPFGKQLHNDLSGQLQQQQQQQLHSSSASSSANSSSQHSSSTAPGNGGGGATSTSRHYLFASPAAVNTYKSSLVQQTPLNNNNNHHLPDYHQARFMQS